MEISVSSIIARKKSETLPSFIKIRGLTRPIGCIDRILPCLSVPITPPAIHFQFLSNIIKNSGERELTDKLSSSTMKLMEKPAHLGNILWLVYAI